MIRQTRQRKAIQNVFKSIERPLNPQEILEEANAFYSGLGIATVYRCIKQLLEEGSLIPVDVPGGKNHYELAGKKHHHHFHCRECSRVFEVDGCVGNFNKMKPKGFQLESHEVILFGLCAECVSTA